MRRWFTAVILVFALLWAPSLAQDNREYVCVLHPENKSTAPGACPACGWDRLASDLVASGLFSYTCPNHRELQQSRPGACDRCGTRLIVEDLRVRPRIAYVCPMHPAVTASFPGKCPRCAMDLMREDQLNRKSAAYRCPMDPEVVSGTPAKCSRCGMNLIAVDPSELARYPLELSVDPPVFRSGQKIRLRFAATNPVTRERVKQFDVVHDKRFHLFIVSQDLEYFDHIHPAQSEDGSFFIDTVLPRPAFYRVFSDFMPAGGTPQLIQKNLVTSDCESDLQSSVARLTADTVLSKTIADMTVTLKSDPSSFIAGREGTLIYALTDAATGAPVTDLRPYLGAWGHTFIVNQDASESIHSHPADEVKTTGEPQGASRPEISFQAYFSKPGHYRAWTQFLRGERLLTFVFTIEVRRLR